MFIFPLTNWMEPIMTLGHQLLNYEGYVDHLTHPTPAENEVFRWLKIDSQLCIVIKSTMHSSLKQIFRTYETCSEVWDQAKLLYTNDTQRLYGVCQNLLTIVAPKRLDGGRISR